MSRCAEGENSND